MVSPYKADWAEAERRLTALWQGERLERPCVSVIAPQRCEKPTPLPTVEKCEDIWLDPAYRVAATRHQLENRWWGGEALPSALQMAGWVMCLGGTPHFDDRTIWFEVEEAYFSRPSSFRHDPESIWTKGYEELMMAVARDAGEGEYMVGSACALPANDLLPMLRVVQYTPTPGEPPNGPAHLEMYRAIQAAGKIVHISLSQIHFEQLIRELDPTLLMLDTWVGSVSEGEKLLEQCAAWMR
jgi:hypothetical protein